MEPDILGFPVNSDSFRFYMGRQTAFFDVAYRPGNTHVRRFGLCGKISFIVDRLFNRRIRLLVFKKAIFPRSLDRIYADVLVVALFAFLSALRSRRIVAYVFRSRLVHLPLGNL